MEDKEGTTCISWKILNNQIESMINKYDEEKKEGAKRIKRELIQECVNKICIKYNIKRVNYRDEELLKKIENFNFSLNELNMIKKGCKNGKMRRERFIPYEDFRKATWTSKLFSTSKKIYSKIYDDRLSEDDDDDNYDDRLSEDDDDVLMND